MRLIVLFVMIVLVMLKLVSMRVIQYEDKCSRGIDMKMFLYHIRLWLRKILRDYRLGIVSGLSDIHIMAGIPNSTRFVHRGLGVVIDNNVRMGRNCKIYQHVTLGGINNGRDTCSPILGNNVTIYSYASVFGGVRLGDGCVVGAGSLVLDDVPSGCLVYGIPARVIRNIKEKNTKRNID